jgi:prevent-host-death family protein
MATVSISELSRNASRVVDEVEKTRRPAIVTNHGRVVASLVPVDQEHLEDFILANAPEFVRSLEEAEEDFRQGRMHRLDDVMAEIEAEEKKKRRTGTTPGRRSKRG